MASEFGATLLDPGEIYSARADIFAPCALGAVINAQTIPSLNCAIICGAANNQLLHPGDSDLLAERNILYVPDYAANAGGVISICCTEMLGWEASSTSRKIDAIYDTIIEILQLAKSGNTSSFRAADMLAERRIPGIIGQ